MKMITAFALLAAFAIAPSAYAKPACTSAESTAQTGPMPSNGSWIPDYNPRRGKCDWNNHQRGVRPIYDKKA